MTTKRFQYDWEDNTGHKFIDLEKHEKYSLETIGDYQNIEYLLNSLAEKNKRLKQSIIRIGDMADEYWDRVQELDEENTRLKILLHKKKTCSACKNLKVIVSEQSDYWCSCKNEYLNLNDFCEDCESYEMDNLSLREKEHRVWD